MRTRACLIVLLALSNAAFSQWKMAEKSIVTRWARQVRPGNVWSEYPRPQAVRSEWKNLNGLWDFDLLPKVAGEPAAYSTKILVPFCVESALSGVGQDVS